MFLFFLIFFVFISISLIFLILLQPAKGFNNTGYLNTKNNIKFFNVIGKNNFITNVIGIFSFLFLVVSVILCNINSKKMDKDLFWEDNTKKTVTKQIFSKNNINSDIPH